MTTPEVLPPTDPRYNYSDVRPAALSVSQLDQLMGFVIQGGITSAWTAALAAAKIAIVFYYMNAREKLVAAEAAYLKFKNERDTATGNQADANAALPPGATR